MDILGEQIYSISVDTYQAIINKFEQNNFNKFERLYLARVRDLPRMNLTFRDYTINFQTKACPEKLTELMRLIESLIPKK